MLDACGVNYILYVLDACGVHSMLFVCALCLLYVLYAFCIYFMLAYMLRKTLQLCRFERWNVTDEMINQAKTDYIAVSGPDAAGKREPLKKTGLAGSISAFLAAHASGLQVSPVVALKNMIRWGNFNPDGLFCYHMGNTLSGAKTIMCDFVSCT
jgi:hypothetical protein